MNCPKCNNEVLDNSNHCSSCGHSFKKVCPDCRFELEESMNFCSNCGHSFLENTKLEEINSEDEKLEIIENKKEEFSMLNFLFITKGRVSRRLYAYYLLFYFSVSIFVGVFTAIIFSNDVDKMQIAFNRAIIFISLTFTIPTIIITWKRLQDFNVHGAFALFLLLPVKYFSLFFIVITAFIPGTMGKNNFDIKKK